MRDPLFLLFGSATPVALGAHVTAHLVETGARQVHVPTAAIEDFLAEMDELALSS